MLFVPKFLLDEAQKIVLLKILMDYETIMSYKKQHLLIRQLTDYH